MTPEAKAEVLRHLQAAESHLLMIRNAADRGDVAELLICRRAAEVSLERATAAAEGNTANASRFANGRSVHIFNSWAEAAGAMPEQMKGDGPVSKDGLTIIATIQTDPDMFLGLEPRKIVDHSSDPWPPALREMLEWRAYRAGIMIERPTRV